MEEMLQRLSDLISEKTIICSKSVLTADEAAKYMGVSRSYLYKLTMQQKIPYSKPLGKMCYFNRLELETWLLRNRTASTDELKDRAQAYCGKKGGKV